jgi:transcriptional regulator with XRE-family HTH domain
MSGKDGIFRHPELGQALAWLRRREDISQAELIKRLPTVVQARRPAADMEKVEKEVPAVSFVYYKTIESGRNAPSVAKVEAILGALRSSLPELNGLLETRPWAYEPPRGRRQPPRKDDYRRAAEEALSDGTWSSKIDTPAVPSNFLRTVADAAASAARQDPFSFPPPGIIDAPGDIGALLWADGLTPTGAGLLAAQESELIQIFRFLPEKERTRVLEYARRRRQHASSRP